MLSRGLRPVTAVQDRVGPGRRDRPPTGSAGCGPPAKHVDRDNIQSHYDLSNEFFALMLDETMMYSSAMFDRPGMSLADAQRAKLDRLCTKLGLGPDDHVVEIGTGWGGFAVHAAADYGCRVTTTTISDAQFRYASKRVAEPGLADRVTVLDRDYRDLDGTYDKLVSIEMIEAVDWRQHDTFFAHLRLACCTTEGLMALQAITMDDRSFERAKNGTDFVREFIFPGGCLPSVEAITRSLRRATPMAVVDLEDIGRHYAETLRAGTRTWPPAPTRSTALGLDDRFQRLWDLYLCYCEGAFLERHISDVQMVMAMPDWRAPDGGARLAARRQPDRATGTLRIGVGLPEGPDPGDLAVGRRPVDVDAVDLDGAAAGEGDADHAHVGRLVAAQERLADVEADRLVGADHVVVEGGDGLGSAVALPLGVERRGTDRVLHHARRRRTGPASRRGRRPRRRPSRPGPAPGPSVTGAHGPPWRSRRRRTAGGCPAWSGAARCPGPPRRASGSRR